MQWMEVAVHTTTQGSDVVSALLMELGSTGTEIVDRADIPDPASPGVYWEMYDEKLLEDMPQDVLVKGWFEVGQSTADTLAALKGELAALLRGQAENPAPLGTLALDMKEVQDADWAENWKQYYKPFRVGSRLVVKPTWESYRAGEGDVLIELDPGMAFGTGTHETTHMCMELLEEHLRGGMRVMDVGTGSGILAIAAAKLGADNILAIDIDPDAVKVAKENVALNGVDGQVRVVCADLVSGKTMACELAVANIVADAICMLAAPLTRHLLPGGLLVCSGIIKEREADVLRSAGEAGYTLVERMTQGEWVALCLARGR